MPNSDRTPVVDQLWFALFGAKNFEFF